jgi:hypothetical protein
LHACLLQTLHSPASASSALGLRVCSTTSSFNLLILLSISLRERSNQKKLLHPVISTSTKALSSLLFL